MSAATLAGEQPAPEQAARIGVDLWDTAAHLEASGFSDRVARAAGHASTANWARVLLRDADVREPLPRQHAARRAGDSVLGAALSRALIMAAGVIVCVSTRPRGATELTVFTVAAIGWLTAQVVSATIWHGLDLGSVGGAARGAICSAALMLLAGAVTWVLLREPTALIWVAWAAAIQVLVILRPGRVLTLSGGAAGLLSLLAWQFGTRSQALAVAIVATLLAVAGAIWVLWVTLRGSRSSVLAGVNRAMLVAVGQTAAQLGLLLVIFSRVGPGAFATVALAGLAVGVLADPLFALTRLVSTWAGRRFTAWLPCRLVVAAVGPPLVVVLCVAAMAVTQWTLADPYGVYLDAPIALTAAAVLAAIMAAINALLRTGSALGAMVFTVLASGLAGLALVVRVPGDEAWQSTPFLLATLAVVGVATLVVSRRLSRPQTW